MSIIKNQQNSLDGWAPRLLYDMRQQYTACAAATLHYLIILDYYQAGMNIASFKFKFLPLICSYCISHWLVARSSVQFTTGKGFGVSWVKDSRRAWGVEDP